MKCQVLQPLQIFYVTDLNFANIPQILTQQPFFPSDEKFNRRYFKSISIAECYQGLVNWRGMYNCTCSGINISCFFELSTLSLSIIHWINCTHIFMPLKGNAKAEKKSWQNVKYVIFLRYTLNEKKIVIKIFHC